MEKKIQSFFAVIGRLYDGKLFNKKLDI